MPEANLKSDLLELMEGLERYSSRVFLAAPTEDISFAEFLSRVKERGSTLARAGILPRDTVALYHSEPATLLVEFFALLSLRAVPVLLSSFWSPAQLIPMLQKVHPEYMSYTSNRQSSLEPIWSSLKLKGHFSETMKQIAGTTGSVGKEHSSGTVQTTQQQFLERFALMVCFSSGTEREPHPVFLGSGLSQRAVAVARAMGLKPEDRLKVDPDFASILNLVSGALACMVSGSSVDLTEPGAQSTVALLNRPGLPESIRSLKEKGARVYYSYGLAEAGGPVTVGESMPETWHCGGVLDGIEIRFRTLESAEESKSRGGSALKEGSEFGEIEGRWKDVQIWSEGNQEPSQGVGEGEASRWISSGDLGQLDGHSLLFRGRSSERIVRGGYEVMAPDVEEALNGYSDIVESAVVGIKDSRMGQEIIAFIAQKEGTSVDNAEIKTRLRNQLAPQQIPAKILSVAEFPRSSSGELQKLRMAEEYLRNQKLLNRIPGSVDIEYNWVYGRALSRFYTGLKEEEKIYGTRCPGCHKVQVPPKIYCGVCFLECSEYIEVPGAGVLESFTTVHLEYPGQPRKPPYTYGYIKLDGAHTHLYHLVDGLDVSEIHTGMRVEAVWKPREHRAGTLYDIEHFQPAGGP